MSGSVYTRHNEVPVYEQRNSSVSASQYNQVRLGLNRLQSSLRLPLPELRSLQLLLQDDAWIIVDTALADLPVAAWSDFEIQGRDNLHEPIACRLRLYHAQALILVPRVLASLDTQLRERLTQAPDT